MLALKDDSLVLQRDRKSSAGSAGHHRAYMLCVSPRGTRDDMVSLSEIVGEKNEGG